MSLERTDDDTRFTLGVHLLTELLSRQPWPTRTEATTAVFDYIEGFYNRRRRHSTLDYLSPTDYETRHAAATAAA
jgi:transposase InsO family protein